MQLCRVCVACAMLALASPAVSAEGAILGSPVSFARTASDVPKTAMGHPIAFTQGEDAPPLTKMGHPIQFTREGAALKTMMGHPIQFTREDGPITEAANEASSTSSASAESEANAVIAAPPPATTAPAVTTLLVPAQVDPSNPYSKVKGTGGNAKSSYVLSAAYSANLPADNRDSSHGSIFAPLLVAGCVASAIGAIGFVVLKRRRMSQEYDDDEFNSPREDASPSMDVGSSSLYSVLTPTPMLSAV